MSSHNFAFTNNKINCNIFSIDIDQVLLYFMNHLNWFCSHSTHTNPENENSQQKGKLLKEKAKIMKKDTLDAGIEAK